MPGRSYDGDAIDASWKTPPWERDGETVGVVDSNRGGTEVAECSESLFEGGQIKTNIDGGTDLATDILKKALVKPNGSVREIATEVGCDPTYAWRVMKRQSAFDKYQKDRLEELSDNASEIIRLYVNKPEWTQREISESVEVSEAYVSNVLSANEHLISELGGDA